MNKFIKNSRLCFSHFQTKLLCAFLLCTLIPIFIIGGISYAVSYNIAEDKILNASISSDEQLHTQFYNRLLQIENVADSLQYDMYHLMQAETPEDTLTALSEARSNLSMFQASFNLAYISIFLPDEHMGAQENLYFFPLSSSQIFSFPAMLWKIREHPLSGFTRKGCPSLFLYPILMIYQIPLPVAEF